MTNNDNQLPEAPASATLSVISPKGYNTLFTIRDMSVNELVKKITIVEEKMEELGYKPQVRQTFGAKKEQEFVEGKKCPKDGGRLIKKVSKAGKEYHACENGRFDFATKTTIGCNFVDWLEKKENDFDLPEYHE